jgi:hypothetical protein
MGCDEDDRHLPVRSSKVALKLKTASPRHSHVEHQATGTLRRISLEKIVNRRKLPGMQANRPQQPHDRVAKLGIIIDDQDAGICVTHPGISKLRILPAMAPILSTIRWLEQHLLLKRIAQGLSHRLGAPTLLYCYNLHAARGIAPPPVWWSKEVVRKPIIDPHTRIYRRR